MQVEAVDETWSEEYYFGILEVYSPQLYLLRLDFLKMAPERIYGNPRILSTLFQEVYLEQR